MDLLDNVIDTTKARAELAALETQLRTERDRNAELRTIIALNKYVRPPFDLVDDATVELAVMCAEKDDRIIEADRIIWMVRNSPNRPKSLYEAAMKYLTTYSALSAAPQPAINERQWDE